MNRPIIENAEKYDLRIKGIKLYLNCKICNRIWAIWFEDEKDLLENLPNDWFYCKTCKHSTLDKEFEKHEYNKII
jgi:uncharacterized protein YlaI